MAVEKPRFNLPELEERVLKFWEENDIFKKTLEKNKKGKRFVFYEGPPTANGRPGIHHVLARAFKDAVCRYKTMQGFLVPRKAGWDTHGLPVEIEVEKALGFKTKHDIEKFGIGKFNQKAKESVWRYKDEWEKATRRIGFWLDLGHPYVTYEPDYIETLWWILKEVWKKKLLYRDFKVVPWCPRCETGLSSHEVGLGYKKVRENTVFVKLRLKGRSNEYLLVWTTTPWTLPGNVAVALNPRVDYTKFRVGNELIWSVVPPPALPDVSVSVVEKVSGKKLLGLHYEPLYAFHKDYCVGNDPEYKTIAGEFVGTEEGTGMVHIAPAFGEEDMAAVRETWGKMYPILQTVHSNGTIKKGFPGEGKFVKDADPFIIEDLKRRGLLFKIVPYEHEYPFCWRCATPLLYFARHAWWIGMSTLRNELVANNERIRWIPEHIKEGRFGEFLREVRDWAISRERYWGTPLPLWSCKKCGTVQAVGSLKELDEYDLSPMTLFLMRHGEALHNVEKVVNPVSFISDKKSELTKKGEREAVKAARAFAKEKIEVIISSPSHRAQRTAHIVARAIGVSRVETMEEFRDLDVRGFEGMPVKEYDQSFANFFERFTAKPRDAENWRELRVRVMRGAAAIRKKYAGRNVLLVTHGDPSWVLGAAMEGLREEEYREVPYLKTGQYRKIRMHNFPYDEAGEVNLHKPYIDAVFLRCFKCGGIAERVSEVADVWFDSGSMPFAQYHYPFAFGKNSKSEKLPYPADYICEAIDQTRGWFYTLLAVGTLLSRGPSYRNVISLGHVLDKNGQKMSKSKGNAVEPGVMIQKYGADALRWYFYTINAPGESKRFDEKDLFTQLKNFLGTWWNSFVFFDTYVDKIQSQKSKIQNFQPQGVLNRWILLRLDEVTLLVTKKLDDYDLTGAARLIEEFVIGDFSQWFLRRSRRRFQHPRNAEEKKEAALLTGHVLFSVAALAAPFVPFLSEAIYQELRRKTKMKWLSIHLVPWPTPSGLFSRKDALNLRDQMQVVRTAVTEGLNLRASVGIKVRQPLASLTIPYRALAGTQELLEILKEELNVKEILFGGALALDTHITPELKEEGFLREMIRNVQEMRRDLGLRPRNSIRVQCVGSSTLYDFLEKWGGLLKKETATKHIAVGGKKVFQAEREFEINGEQIWIGVSF